MIKRKSGGPNVGRGPLNLKQLKVQAKELRDAVRSGADAAIARVLAVDARRGDGFEATHYKLSGAQYVIALEHGFASWPELRQHLELRAQTGGPNLAPPDGVQSNRTKALHRLRERIAMDVRGPFDLASPELPEEFVAQRGAKGSLAVNPRNPSYPIIAATALDALAAADGSYAKAAKALGLTTSQLLRFLRSDTHVWREAESIRR